MFYYFPNTCSRTLTILFRALYAILISKLALERLILGPGIFNTKYSLPAVKRRITFVRTWTQEPWKLYMPASVSMSETRICLWLTSLTSVLSYCFTGITRLCVHIWYSVCRFLIRLQHFCTDKTTLYFNCYFRTAVFLHHNTLDITLK